MQLLDIDRVALAEYRWHKRVDAEVARVTARAKARLFAMKQPFTSPMRRNLKELVQNKPLSQSTGLTSHDLYSDF